MLIKWLLEVWGWFARGMNLEIQDWSFQDFPSGPVVKTPQFQCREWGGASPIPGWVRELTCCLGCSQKKKDWSFQPHPHTARERRVWRLHSVTNSQWFNQTWNVRKTLRTGFGGCQVGEHTKGRVGFKRRQERSVCPLPCLPSPLYIHPFQESLPSGCELYPL